MEAASQKWKSRVFLSFNLILAQTHAPTHSRGILRIQKRQANFWLALTLPSPPFFFYLQQTSFILTQSASDSWKISPPSRMSSRILFLLPFLFLLHLQVSYCVYIPPGPKYPCPQEPRLIYPCLCIRGADTGLVRKIIQAVLIRTLSCHHVENIRRWYTAIELIWLHCLLDSITPGHQSMSYLFPILASLGIVLFTLIFVPLCWCHFCDDVAHFQGCTGHCSITSRFVDSSSLTRLWIILKMTSSLVYRTRRSSCLTSRGRSW